MVVVNVLPVNDSPQFSNSEISLPEDMAIVGAFAAFDVENDPLTFSADPSVLPQFGEVFIQPNGVYSYTPSANFSGTDSFGVIVSDGAGGFAQATVFVNVIAQNDAPVAQPDFGGGAEGDPVTVDVVSNDTDVDGPGGFTLTTVAITSVTGLSTPTGGTVSVVDNELRFDPGTAFDELDAGDVATVVVSYEVEGDSNATDIGTATITVAGENDAPIAVADAAGGDENAVLTIDVLANDTDVDLSDTPSNFALVSATITGVTGLSGPSGGSVSVFGNQVRFDPGSDFDELDDGDTAVVTVSYTMQDDSGAPAVGTLEITVSGGNDAPAAVADTASGGENAVLTIDVLANDTDVDLSDTPSSFNLVSAAITSVTGLSAASGGSVSVLGNQVQFDPGTAFDELNAGDTATVNISYTMTDDVGLPDAGSLTITVTGANDGPVLVSAPSDARGEVDEGVEENTVSGQLLAEDADAGESVSWSGTSFATLGVFTVSENGAWTYELDNGLADSLAENEIVVETFQAVGSEPNGLSLIQNIEVTVTGTNDAPILSINSFFETVSGEALEGALSAVDLDGPVSSLTFELSGAGTSNGSVSISPDGTFTYTPNDGFAGTDSFEYTVRDANGGVSSARARIAVQSDPSETENENIFLGVNEIANLDTAAGAVEIGVTELDTSALNLAIALNRSGSIGEDAWIQLVASVRAALVTLRDQFAGSDTQVDVQVITYATNVTSTAVLDLNDPALLTVVDALVDDYVGGFTRWDRALNATGDFFFNEPLDEKNFLLFVSDGEPTTDAYLSPLAELLDPTDAFDITIEAFGFGSAFADGSLSELDPDAVFLDDSALLAEALEGSAIFNPQLVSFEITLETEDNAQIVIGDESSEGVIVEGLNVELPLASIANIADLLGETNLIGITALFDLDNDISDAEIQVFSSDVIGKASVAQTLTGLDRPDLLFGSDAGDTISGGAGDDVILAFDGADTLSGGTGQDDIRAGGGDDVVRITALTEVGDKIDGGDGRDTLEVEAVGEISALIGALDIEGIEVIDMDNTQDDALSLSFDEIVDLSEESDTSLEALLASALPYAISVYGDTGDTLTLDGQGLYSVNQTGTVTDASGTYLAVYAFSVGAGSALATVGVDVDVDVSTSNVVA